MISVQWAYVLLGLAGVCLIFSSGGPGARIAGSMIAGAALILAEMIPSAGAGLVYGIMLFLLFTAGSLLMRNDKEAEPDA